MRNKGRMILTALVAVLALGVVASASASAALPEFVPGEGKLPITFEGSQKEARSEIEQIDGFNLGECRGLKDKGSITGAKALSFTLELENCVQEKEACSTSGAAKGHEVLSGTGTLVYIDKATKRVGVLLTFNAAKVLCGEPPEFKVRSGGTVVVPIASLNTKTSKLELTIHCGGGHSEYRHYENEQGKEIGTLLEADTLSGYMESGIEIEGITNLSTSKPLTVEG